MCCVLQPTQAPEPGHACAMQGPWSLDMLAGCKRNTCGLHATHTQILAPHKYSQYSRFAPVLYQAIGTPPQMNIITSHTIITTLCLLLYPIHLPRDHLKASLWSRVSVTTHNRSVWQLPILQARGICCPLCLHSRVTQGVVIDRDNDTENRSCVILCYFIVFICRLDCNQISWLKI